MTGPASSGSRERATLGLEIVLVVGALIALLVSFLWIPERGPDLPLCQFRRWTGLPCPGCGLTRGICAISRGEFQAAWNWNPFSYLFYGFTIMVLLWPLLRRAAPVAHDRIVGSRWFVRAPIILVLTMWAWGLWRIGMELLIR